MTRYHRLRQPGGAFFFAVNLADRRQRLLTDPSDALRGAFREVRQAHPFIHIHYNPVKHGWAKRVRDWPYSSCHRYVRLGVYPIDWGGHEVDGLDFEAG